MTLPALNNYRDLIDGTRNGKAVVFLSDLKNLTPRSLCIGYTETNQMIHICVFQTPTSETFFLIQLSGNEAGGFINTMHLLKSITHEDLKKLKIKAVFVEYSDIEFLESIYTKGGHYKVVLIRYNHWFESTCLKSGYPSQLALYITEDILSASSIGVYFASISTSVPILKY